MNEVYFPIPSADRTKPKTNNVSPSKSPVTPHNLNVNLHEILNTTMNSSIQGADASLNATQRTAGGPPLMVQNLDSDENRVPSFLQSTEDKRMTSQRPIFVNDHKKTDKLVSQLHERLLPPTEESIMETARGPLFKGNTKYMNLLQLEKVSQLPVSSKVNVNSQ